MNNPSAYIVCRIYLRQSGALALLVSLFALINACTASKTGIATGQKLRLRVGEIREITIIPRADTTWKLTATSDNQEVVDVSRKSSAAIAAPIPAAGPAAFLIKGITVGTAKVVFTENQPGSDGTGLVKKAYVVTVTTN